ncbi:uncharacterized protein LOC142616656 [Castanea sativa]|uniref:uncharacterized protein LOC142616656 n=1 Tax=Castanea sativa TaxID=21020 RepID=UPI003F653D10
MFSKQIGRNMEVYVDDMLVKSKEELTHLDDLGETFNTLRRYQMKLNPSKCVFGVASRKFLGFMVSQRGIEANPEKVQAILNMASPKTVKDVQKLTGRIAALNRTAIKAQALANFIAEFTLPDDDDDKNEVERWTIQTDGSSTQKRGGVGVIINTPDGEKLQNGVQLKFPATNNEAEYEGILTGLRLGKALGLKNLLIQSDSKLAIGQIREEYEVKEERMQKYLKLIKHLARGFDKLDFVRIPRNQNAAADEVTKMASSEEEPLNNEILMEIQKYPSIEEVPANATELVKRCDKCQRFGNVQRLPAEKMTTITSPWPFAQWGIDIVGPLPLGKGQFDSQGFRNFCSGLGIKNKFSSPGHPQSNGQTEVTNRTLLRIIKARLDEAKGAWPEEFPNVLWAYRTTARTPTGETPFRLTYGTEAVIPVEVGMASTRREVFREENNDDQLRINLDCLDEVRDKASNMTMKYQQKMTEYYNKRVRLRRLEIGDLVLRKVTTATGNSAHGKLGPTWEGPYKVVHYSRQGSYHLETLDG